MKKLLLLTAVICTCFTLVHAQFTGCYDGSNWMQNTTNTNGTVFIQAGGLSMLADTDGSGNGPGTVLDCAMGGSGNVSACIVVPFTGQFSFTWSWSGGSSSTFSKEPFGYCKNGIPVTLTNGVGGGMEVVNVAAGDAFCFVVSSQFSDSHPTLPTAIGVTNFSGPCPPGGCQAGFTSLASATPDSILFTDASVGAITSRLWDFGDGDTSTAVNPSHKYASSGNFSVCLTVFSGITCTDSICHTVSITATSNEESDNDVDFSIVPNPNNGNFRILFDGNGQQAPLRVVDLTGRIVHEEENILSDIGTTVEISFLPPAIYLLEVMMEDRWVRQRIIIN